MGLIGLLVLLGATLAVNLAVVGYLFYVLLAYVPMPEPFRWAIVIVPCLVVIHAVLARRSAVGVANTANRDTPADEREAKRWARWALFFLPAKFSLALILLSLVPLVWRELPESDNFWLILLPLCVIAVLAYFWQRK